MTLTKADIVEKVAKNGFIKRKFATMVETILEITRNTLSYQWIWKILCERERKTEREQFSDWGGFIMILIKYFENRVEKDVYERKGD